LIISLVANLNLYVTNLYDTNIIKTVGYS